MAAAILARNLGPPRASKAYMATHAIRAHHTPAWLVWLGFVVLCNGAGFLSSLAGTESGLYASLERPAWSPPAWIFAPMWTALYTLMGTATYLVWRDAEGAARRRALAVFGVQLALNVAWSPVFFGLQQYGAALVVIVANWLAVTAMMIVYARCKRLAGALIVPLWLWVGFATALNASIWLRN